MNLGKVGKLGEDIAELFLKKHNFTVIQRNYYTKFGEIDIIAQKQDFTHFVEVKSVSREIEGIVLHETNIIDPVENMTPEKLSKLAKVISIYITKHKIEKWQFDIVLVYVDVERKKSIVKFLENQLLPE